MLRWFLLYLAFVVYGSLVPFEFTGGSLDTALTKFRAIGYLKLGIESRADWIANIVLYVPLAFLGCAGVAGLQARGVVRLLSVVVVLAFCLAVAVAVEFTQIFFAPRTVSLNDLIAEALGSLFGILLFFFGHERWVRLLEDFARGGRPSVVAVITLYGLAYVLLSLFPYDFVVSPDEIAWKFESGNLGWLLGGSCTGLRCVAQQVAELGGIAPLGLLMALAAQSLSVRRVFLAGVGLGLVLETVQVFIASGVSQGMSVVWRGAGLALGHVAGRQLRRLGIERASFLLWRAMPWFALPYVLLLAALNGWFTASWMSADEALGRFAELRLMPFYYHYFTTETAAMTSLLAQSGMYAPVGLAVWAWRMRGAPVLGGEWVFAVAVALLLAFPVEFGKLWVPGQHPDPTNLLIAGASAACACALMNWLTRVLIGARPNQGEPSRERSDAPQTTAPITSTLPPLRVQGAWHSWGLAMGGLAAAGAAVGVGYYPIGRIWLLAALVGYGVLVWRKPMRLFFVVPALLALLDLSPVTGRLLLDEFDLVVLVTLAVSYPWFWGRNPRPWPNRWLAAAVVLLWLSWTWATARGLWPLLGSSTSALDSSHSPLETWRVGKGLLWALLFVPLLRRVPLEYVDTVRNHLAGGLIAGLVGVGLVVFWERLVFVGLTDFDHEFRVTGPFASMNTGGAYIEAYLAFAFPLLVVGVLLARGWMLQLLGIVVAALVSYAMMVTFSRGGYAGFVVGLLPIALGLSRKQGRSLVRWLVLCGLVAASVVVAVPVLSGGFAQARLAGASSDLSIRFGHWRRALDLMDDGPWTALGGMGFGQYPSAYLLRAETNPPPGTFAILNERGNRYLSLGAGESIFLDQIVSIEPGARYTATMRLRPPPGGGALNVMLCAKALLYSFECTSQRLRAEALDRRWITVSAKLEVNRWASPIWLPRPIKLSLQNAGPGAIEVDDVSLKDESGQEWVTNGRFEGGSSHWLLVTDDKTPWHIDQMEVEVYFAQGLLGLVALALLCIGTLEVLGSAVWAQDLRASGFIGAVLAFLTVGLLGSTLDTARLGMLFYLGALGAALLVPASSKERQEA